MWSLRGGGQVFLADLVPRNSHYMYVYVYMFHENIIPLIGDYNLCEY